MALSDGSIRCVNGSNGAYLSILEFPSEESCHISALTWDCTGKSLASSLSSGHIVLWDVEDEEKSSCSADESCNEVTERVIHITSTAVLEGGLCWRLLISHSLAFYHILKDMILIFRNDSDRIGHTSGRSIFGTKYLSVDNDDEKVRDGFYILQVFYDIPCFFAFISAQPLQTIEQYRSRKIA